MMVIALTTLGGVMIEIGIFMATIAATWGAQHQEHLGPKRCQVLLAMQVVTEESTR